ncbi:acyltransferase family protein [Arthrobacter sp. HS15c]|uniref:acyltransferase family protein n=1 Tax=Arthrobacter sp. HS15c TaxID=3230279 RepID=UPI003467D88A
MSIDANADTRPQLFVSGRLAALDGLRTPAVMAVFLYHSASGFMPGGWSGVDTFFALSGFVITLLLVKEHASRGSIRLGRFYVQRLARLWPALLIVCVPVAAASVLLPSSGWGGQGSNALQGATYVMNIFRSGLVGVTTAGGALGHTWTLAVEEQFYLVWPLLLIVMLRLFALRTITIITGLLALAAVAERVAMVATGVGLNRLYNGPDTRADQLLLGCVLALLFMMIKPGSVAASRMASISSKAIWPAALVLVASAFLLAYPKDAGAWFNFYWMFGPFILAFVATALISGLATNPDHRLAKVLAHPWMSWPGQNLSYGVYLWHLPLIYLLLPVIEPLVIRVPVVFVLTGGLAYLSARFVESPIRARVKLRLDKRSERLPAAEPARAG